MARLSRVRFCWCVLHFMAVNRVDTDDDVIVVHVRAWRVLEESCVSFCLRRTCHVTSVTRTYSHTS